MGRPQKPEGQRASDIAPTGVRLPPELRDALLRESTINRRSLSQEITARLKDSFKPAARASAGAPAAASPQSVYDASKGSGSMLMEAQRQMQLSEHERLLLSHFKTLSPEKQLALLTVLKR